MTRAPKSASWNAIASCMAQSTASVTMILVNKAISLSAVQVKTGDFVFIAYQCLVATVLVEILRWSGKVSYKANTKLLVQWLPVSVCFVSMLFTSFMGMKTISVPVLTVFKNLTNVFIVFGDWYFNSQHVTPLIALSLIVMCSGAVLTSTSDVEFQASGYIWMGLNCLSTAAYVLVMKYATKTVKIERAGMVYYNNLMRFPSFVMLSLLSFAKGEPADLIKGGQMSSMLLFLVTFSGAVGVLLSFTSLWCVSSTSATTYAIVGTSSKVPTTVLGAIIFHSKVTVSGALYIIVVMIGGFLYSWAKLQENSKTAEKVHQSPAVKGVNFLLHRDNDVNSPLHQDKV